MCGRPSYLLWKARIRPASTCLHEGTWQVGCEWAARTLTSQTSYVKFGYRSERQLLRPSLGTFDIHYSLRNVALFYWIWSVDMLAVRGDIRGFEGVDIAKWENVDLTKDVGDTKDSRAKSSSCGYFLKSSPRVFLSLALSRCSCCVVLLCTVLSFSLPCCQGWDCSHSPLCPKGRVR